MIHHVLIELVTTQNTKGIIMNNLVYNHVVLSLFKKKDRMKLFEALFTRDNVSLLSGTSLNVNKSSLKTPRLTNMPASQENYIYLSRVLSRYGCLASVTYFPALVWFTYQLLTVVSSLPTTPFGSVKSHGSDSSSHPFLVFKPLDCLLSTDNVRIDRNTHSFSFNSITSDTWHSFLRNNSPFVPPELVPLQGDYTSSNETEGLSSQKERRSNSISNVYPPLIAYSNPQAVGLWGVGILLLTFLFGETKVVSYKDQYEKFIQIESFKNKVKYEWNRGVYEKIPHESVKKMKPKDFLVKKTHFTSQKSENRKNLNLLPTSDFFFDPFQLIPISAPPFMNAQLFKRRNPFVPFNARQRTTSDGSSPGLVLLSCVLEGKETPLNFSIEGVRVNLY
jgi:hypothetical protein